MRRQINNRNVLLSALFEAIRFANLLALNALVGPARRQILVLVNAAAGPFDHQAIDFGAFAHAKGHGELRLRQIAGTAPHHSRLVTRAIKQANCRADGISVGIGSLKTKTNAAIPAGDVGSIKPATPTAASPNTLQTPTRHH